MGFGEETAGKQQDMKPSAKTSCRVREDLKGHELWGAAPLGFQGCVLLSQSVLQAQTRDGDTAGIAARVLEANLDARPIRAV